MPHRLGPTWASACGEWTRANLDAITDCPAARLPLWTMLRAGFVRNLAVVALVAVSCGPWHGTASPPTSKSNASAARQQCPANQTAPHFVPAPPSNRNLEIIFFKASQRFVVRDITDILHPTTVSTFDDLWRAQFISSSEISYTKATDLIRFALAGLPQGFVAPFLATQAFHSNA